MDTVGTMSCVKAACCTQDQESRLSLLKNVVLDTQSGLNYSYSRTSVVKPVKQSRRMLQMLTIGSAENKVQHSNGLEYIIYSVVHGNHII